MLKEYMVNKMLGTPGLDSIGLAYLRGKASCFESTPSSFKLKLKASYTVSEALLILIQKKLDPQTKRH